MKGYFEETLDRVGLALSDYREKITVFGFCGIKIEGHKGLTDYSPECVAVKIGRKKLIVRGSRLAIKEVTCDELFINGKIRGLEVDDAE